MHLCVCELVYLCVQNCLYWPCLMHHSNVCHVRSQVDASQVGNMLQTAVITFKIFFIISIGITSLFALFLLTFGSMS